MEKRIPNALCCFNFKLKMLLQKRIIVNKNSLLIYSRLRWLFTFTFSFRSYMLYSPMFFGIVKIVTALLSFIWLLKVSNAAKVM